MSVDVSLPSGRVGPSGRDRLTWRAIVPMKDLPTSKSRLRLPEELRRNIALGMLMDTMSVLLKVPSVGEVVLLTGDLDLAREADRLGIRSLADRGDGDLNLALREAMREAEPVMPTVVVPADLPCLRANYVETFLKVASRGRGCFAADADGSGTTLAAFPDPMVASPAYGRGSAHFHALAGMRSVEVPVWLRRDVDTVEHLSVAEALGLGINTRSAARQRTTARTLLI